MNSPVNPSHPASLPPDHAEVGADLAVDDGPDATGSVDGGDAGSEACVIPEAGDESECGTTLRCCPHA